MISYKLVFSPAMCDASIWVAKLAWQLFCIGLLGDIEKVNWQVQMCHVDYIKSN